MRRLMVLGILVLAACEGTGALGGGDGGRTEYMVIGNRMTFEQCRARGGLIIRDSDTAMVACDPSVRREPAPADQFDHPTSNTGS